MEVNDYEDTMSVASGRSFMSSVMTRHEPGKIVTHQASQEWSDPGKNNEYSNSYQLRCPLVIFCHLFSPHFLSNSAFENDSFD